VSDSGIGMTRDELVENLGTIAHSGATAFLNGLEEGKRPSDIIGQFGVGFYSVFMVAEEVTVTTRSYRPEAQAWRWTSTGDSRFTLASAEKDDRGTSHLTVLAPIVCVIPSGGREAAEVEESPGFGASSRQ
jgi:molecular chaperone HtpG